MTLFWGPACYYVSGCRVESYTGAGHYCFVTLAYPPLKHIPQEIIGRFHPDPPKLLRRVNAEGFRAVGCLMCVCACIQFQSLVRYNFGHSTLSLIRGVHVYLQQICAYAHTHTPTENKTHTCAFIYIYRERERRKIDMRCMYVYMFTLVYMCTFLCVYSYMFVHTHIHSVCLGFQGVPTYLNSSGVAYTM